MKAALVLFALAIGCSGCGASARQTAIKTALVTVDTARDGFLAYDAAQQAAIVTGATDAITARAALASYRQGRDATTGPAGVLTAAYRAVAAAAVANDNPSLAGMTAALSQLALALKPYIPGGGK